MTIFATIFFLNSRVKAQLAQIIKPFRGDTSANLQLKYNSDTLINLGHTLTSQPEKLYIGFRGEFGAANIPKLQFSLGFDIGVGNWVIQGDYRQYGGDPRQNNTPATAWGVPLFAGWFPNGNPISSPVADLATTLDGINEFSLIVGKVFSYAKGTIVLMPLIGLAAVTRNYVQYHNCTQVTQQGTGWILFIPTSQPESWYQYTSSIESDVNITIPVSLHMLVKFSSWIGLSVSGWAEIGNGGTSGVSVGLELGILP